MFSTVNHPTVGLGFVYAEKKAEIKAERNKNRAKEVFEELDTNKDNLLVGLSAHSYTYIYVSS